jgi:sulfur-carrier protein
MTTRVVLPYHLRSLAQASGEVSVEATTTREVLDALEAAHPVLKGTMRDPVTGARRSFVRFFACREDLSHGSPDDPLPDAVLRGEEPFLVVGAMAGG